MELGQRLRERQRPSKTQREIQAIEHWLERLVTLRTNRILIGVRPSISALQMPVKKQLRPREHLPTRQTDRLPSTYHHPQLPPPPPPPHAAHSSHLPPPLPLTPPPTNPNPFFLPTFAANQPALPDQYQSLGSQRAVIASMHIPSFRPSFLPFAWVFVYYNKGLYLQRESVVTATAAYVSDECLTRLLTTC